MNEELELMGEQSILCPFCDNKIVMYFTSDGVNAFCDHCNIQIKGVYKYVEPTNPE